VNRALLALWQLTLNDALVKNFFELNYPPELAARLQRQIQEVIDTRQPVRDQTLFTGLNETEMSERFAGFDVAGILEKPYSVATIVAKVGELLRKS
jgi:hypothetical protein